MELNPSKFKSEKYCKDEHVVINGTELCPNNPVERVSWNDIQEFISKLNQGRDSNVYRLPTEAEWEYATRGGSSSAYSFGNDAGQLSEHGWYDENSGGQTHAVGSLAANSYGLHDIHGNVWEWVQDIYGDYPSSSVTDPSGPSSDSLRVIFAVAVGASPAESLRSARRYCWKSSVPVVPGSVSAC